MLAFAPALRRYAYNSSLLYNLRIFIALVGTTAVPWWLGVAKLTIPLTLGVVAAALTDLDDRLAGRLRNLLITLVCFFIASASIELLFPYPWLFILGLALSTCGFILLGALGQRYATIAFGALLIAVYAMISTSAGSAAARTLGSETGGVASGSRPPPSSGTVNGLSTTSELKRIDLLAILFPYIPFHW